jgi:hypothetical protein
MPEMREVAIKKSGERVEMPVKANSDVIARV